MRKSVTLAVAGLAAAIYAAPVAAQEFTFASQGDPRTMDPHAMNEQLTLSI